MYVVWSGDLKKLQLHTYSINEIANTYIENYSNLVRNKILTSKEAEFSGFRIEEK